jgi:hypothetical protein
MWMVSVLILGLIAGHAIDVYGMREHWPFSHYPMYARVEKKQRQELLSLFAFMRAPGYRALVRITDPRYVPPLNEGRLRVILMAAYRRGTDPKNIADTKQVMADYLRTYEARRLAGLHAGPRIEYLALYRLTWKLRPDGTHRTKPWKSDELIRLTWNDLDQPATPPTDPLPDGISEEP